MIIDARTEAPDGPIDCDVLIVGGGPAGITLAMELQSTGARIVVLESGGTDFDERAQLLNDGRLTGLEETDLTAARLRWFGGATNHWGGHCLPLDRIDFDRAPLSGLSGWPMSYDDMQPYFATAGDYCDVGALDYGLGGLAHFDRDTLLIPDEARIETRVIRQSAPTNFGEKYRAAFEASETLNLWLFTTALGVDIDADGRAGRVMAANIDGAELSFEAGAVVLAGGAVENARFLLANNARLGTDFGNAGGFLGACYMDHPVGGAAFLHFDTPVAPRANWEHATTTDGIDAHLVWRLSDEVLTQEALNNIQFFLIPFSDNEAERQLERDARSSLYGMRNVAKWVLGRDRDEIELSDAYCNVIQNADALAVHTYRQMVHGERVSRVLLRYESEQLPSRESYVALDETERDAFGQPRAVLHWSPSLDDREAIVRSATTIGAIVGEAGLGRIELEDHFDARYWDASTAWHQLGTTRMALSPNDGVVDANGRLHGTQNLYVAGGSVFPSGGRANPTLTIVALSVRLAEHLRTERGL